MDDARVFLQRLIPLPGAELLTASAPVPLHLAGLTRPTPTSAPVAVSEEASSIVTQAASILDEEMARGVLAARRSPYGGTSESTGANPMLRQVHDLLDNVAAAWHGLQGVPAGLPGRQPAVGTAEAPARLRPATVHAGARATISLLLRNSESRALRLRPAATDLVGSRGGRIPASLVECIPADVDLGPQEQRELTIAVSIPADTSSGCYSGLLVVRGLEYLRALVTIEVE